MGAEILTILLILTIILRDKSSDLEMRKLRHKDVKGHAPNGKKGFEFRFTCLGSKPLSL